MDRKIKKIIKLRKSSPNPTFKRCYIESEKKYKQDSKRGVYAAILSYDDDKKSFKRFFIKGTPRIWNTTHNKYWMIYDFKAQIGDIIEFRGESKKSAEKKYFIVSNNEKNKHLMQISKYAAFRIIIGYRKDSENDNNQVRYISASVKCYIWERDNHRCVYCGSIKNLEYDHIIPYSWGGSNSPENVQLLCRKCNRRKSDSLTEGSIKPMILSHLKNLDDKKTAY